jgi:hypothetical protein
MANDAMQRLWAQGYGTMNYWTHGPAIRLARVVQTTSCVPVQWDAWTEDGQYLYLRYRQGRGSVTVYPSPDYEAWDPHVQPLIEWDDGTDGYDIELDDFLARSGIERVHPPLPWWKRLLRRLTRR